MHASYKVQDRRGCDNCRHCYEHLDDPYEPHEVPKLCCELNSKHPKDDAFGTPRKAWDTNAMFVARHELERNAWLKWFREHVVAPEGICDGWEC